MSTSDGFSDEQKEYLQGFWSGASAARAALGMPPLLRLPNGDAQAAPPGTSPPATPADTGPIGPAGPERVHWEAQNRFLAAGKKLTAEEKAKREKWPFGMWDEIVKNAAEAKYPKGTDVFLYKFYGLFYTAPNQDGFMSRLKLPNGTLKSWQMAGLAELADRCGGGYSHVTTRANLQIREIKATAPVAYLEGLFELGITSRGSGADNIRNITGSPTAGIDPGELIDTRPLAREIQHYILNKPEFFGLPRKFNIAFDGGGRVAVLEETNDIGFTAQAVPEGQAVPAGVYFRLALGGITGHRDLARDEGVILRPEECTPVSAAIIRVFIEEGDRTDRHKARLKYVLDRMGHAAFLARVETVLGYELARLPLDAGVPRAAIDKLGHIGVHPQRQPGLVYAGVPLLVGRLSSDQMRGLARLAAEFGDGDIRLTVWQNLILSGIPRDRVAALETALAELGLGTSTSLLQAGLVACTGATGCRFALAHTKETAASIVEQLSSELVIDMPVNLHITGCRNSCAQHYIGDIGLLGARVERDDAEIDGFHLFVGGGWGADPKIGRELARSLPAEDIPATVRRMLTAWLAQRRASESFADFTNRHEIDKLRALMALPAPEDAP